MQTNNCKHGESLGQVLRRVRKFCGLTQAHVSKLSRKLFEKEEFHLHTETLRKIEASGNGTSRRPTESRLRALAEIYRIYPAEWLLDRAGVHPNQLAASLSRYPDLRPPFELDISRCLTARAWARVDDIEIRLPRGVKLERVKGDHTKLEILVQQMRQATSGKHVEWIFEIPVIWNDESFHFILDYYVDSPAVLCTLRELYGYPAKLGHAEFESAQPPPIHEAHLTMNGLPLVEIGDAKRVQAMTATLQNPPRRLIHKRILNPDGESLAVDQLVSFSPIQYSTSGTSQALATLRFHTHAFQTLWGVTNQQVLIAYREDLRINMPAGRIEHDYLAS